MKRKNREINIFSISALDLFASGMGAFVLIAVIAMPYYLKTDRSMAAEIAELRQQIEQLSQQLQASNDRVAQLEQQNQDLQAENQQMQAENQNLQAENQQLQAQLAQSQDQSQSVQAMQVQNQQLQERLKSCEEQLEVTFLAIVIKWIKDVDVDLHVVDPRGNEFYFEKKTHTGSAAILSIDAVKGPGIEIWEYSNAIPGVYKVMYNLYKGEVAPTVKGSLYYRGGSKQFPEHTLRYVGRKVQVATIRVTDDGQVNISF